MKKILFVLSFVLGVNAAYSQTEITWDASGNKVLKGFLSKNELANDTAFTWFAANAVGYTPEAGALKAFTQDRAGIHIIVFGGTWCDDTKALLPKFFKLTEVTGFPQSQITVIGVDRAKKAQYNLAEAFQVFNVPTFIVLKNGKEIGRVVEYGKYGMFDKELGEIIHSSTLNR
jgi:thiol-disulfide isomerase/thioredoxin